MITKGTEEDTDERERRLAGAFARQELGDAIVTDTQADRTQAIQPLRVTYAKQLTTFKGTRKPREPQIQGHRIDLVRGSNSLESISSKLSVSSSANDESQHQSNNWQNSAYDKSLSEAPTNARLAGLEDGCISRADNLRSRWISDNEDFQAFTGTPAKLGNLQTTLGDQLDIRKLSSSSSSSSSFSRSHRASTRVVSVSPAGRPKAPFKFAGILSAITASILFSLCTLFVKLLPEYDGISEKAQVLFFRGLAMMILCSVHILSSGSTFRVGEGEILVNCLRSVLGTTAIFGSYCALNYISSGDSTAIVFSSPIWTSILSYFILGEPLQWIHLFALPASIFGIVLIAHPTLIVPAKYLWSLSANSSTAAETGSPLDSQLNDNFDFEQRWPGILIALLTSLLVSCIFIVLRFRRTTSIQATTFWLSTCMTLSGFVLMCFVGVGRLPNTAHHWLLLVANGLLSWLGQIALQWAFFYEQAGLLSIVRTLDVAFTFFLSAVFLDDVIYWTSIVGATIISAVVVSIMLSNWIKTLPCCLLMGKQSDKQIYPIQPIDISIVGAKLDFSGPAMQLSGKTNGSHLPLPDSPYATTTAIKG